MVDISIHALREEGDTVDLLIVDDLGKISIHALREEGDPATSASPCSSKRKPSRSSRICRTGR